MRFVRRLPFCRSGRRRLAAAIFAVVGQTVFAGTTLTLSHEEASAAPHIERAGLDLHHAHNEATCVACRVLSMHRKTQAPVHASFGPIAVVSGSPTIPDTWAGSVALTG